MTDEQKNDVVSVTSVLYLAVWIGLALWFVRRERRSEKRMQESFDRLDKIAAKGRPDGVALIVPAPSEN